MSKLGKYVNIKTGKLDANASSENGQYPFFTCAVKPLKIDTYSYDCECVLVAGNGDLNVKYYKGKFDAYQRTYIIESKDNNILYVPYLYNFLDKYVETLRNLSIGGVIKYIKLGNLTEADIPVPSLNRQKEITSNLDKVTHTIDLCNTILEKMDLLVKSRFVEMFGNPVTNPKKWDVKSVIEESDCMVPGRDKPKSFTGDIPWITIEDLVVNGTTYNSKSGLGLTEKEIKQVNRKTIPAGSVIMSCVGNLGICSIAGSEMIINQQLHSFQCGANINNIYLMFNLTYRKDYMNKWASNTTVLYMNKTICNSIPIMLPPLDLQEQFAAFVAQTQKSKSAVKKVLEKAEMLKKALMQEYFG
ncbi:MAG: restriction endonuclease subunit S [Ruminococcus sp.]|nr:restriction endonuclease subunit S [Ruminococcus sp.]